MDIALHITVDRCVGNFDFARDLTTRDNAQYRVFGVSLYGAHH
jgi:arabinogalactan endo-1,4-beta-galactosidase